MGRNAGTLYERRLLESTNAAVIDCPCSANHIHQWNYVQA